MKELSKITDKERFEIVQPVVRYLKKTWNITAEPKGYKEFIKNYIDFDGYDELNYDKMYKDFKGYRDADRPFPLRVSLPSVAYDDLCQGNKPLEVLIWAIFNYGFAYGKYEQKNDSLVKSQKELVLSLLDNARDLIKDI